MLETRRFPAIGWLFPLLLGPALLVDCSSAGPLSLGDANAGASSSGASSAGSANAGPGNAGSNSAGSIGAAGESGGSNATCPTADCGSALGLLNYECEDGSMGGPTGRCLRRANGSCGWEVLGPEEGGRDMVDGHADTVKVRFTKEQWREFRRNQGRTV